MAKIDKTEQLTIETEIENKVKEKKEFMLPSGKVTIALIADKINPITKDRNEAAAYTGTFRSICVPERERGGFADPLTREEREFLEKELGFDLNPNNDYEKNFYRHGNRKAILEFNKSNPTPESMNIILDKSNPYEYLLYKIALSSPIVCKDYKLKHRAEYEFIIVDEEAIIAEEINITNMQDVVDSYIMNIKGKRKKLFDLLRLFGTNKSNVSVTADSSVDFMYTELRKISKERKHLKTLYEIISLPEGEMEGKILLSDAISLGYISNPNNNVYRDKAGSIIGYNEIEVIKYLNKPENQELKLLIQNLAKQKLSK